MSKTIQEFVTALGGPQITIPPPEGVFYASGDVPMTGHLDMDGNSMFDVGAISAVDGEYSVDVSARSLYDPLGSLALEWGTPGLLSFFSASSFEENAQFVNGIHLNNCDITFEGTLGFAGGFSTAGTGEVRFMDDVGADAIIFSGRSLRDASGTSALAWSNRELFDYSGVASGNWGTRELIDPDGWMAFSWQYRSLHSSGGDSVVTWDGLGIQMSAGTGVWSAQETVAALGSAVGYAGMRRFVTNATATTFGTIVAGGGANAVPVYSDGTNWRIG